MSPARHRDPVTGHAIRQPYRENREYAAAARRFLRAFGRRAACDIDLLPDLFAVQAEAENIMRGAIAGCRDEGYSWNDIGKRLGLTKQAVQQRYGRPARADARPELVIVAGRSDADIAQQVGLDAAAVRRVREALDAAA